MRQSLLGLAGYRNQIVSKNHYNPYKLSVVHVVSMHPKDANELKAAHYCRNKSSQLYIVFSRLTALNAFSNVVTKFNMWPVLAAADNNINKEQNTHRLRTPCRAKLLPRRAFA
jgi:hypothetical protein